VAQLVLCAVVLTMLPVAAQSWPARPVRIIVPFPAGGGLDIVMRLVAQRLSEQTGGSFLVDNRGGAVGVIGAELAARAVPDGYTLFTSAPEFSINPSIRKLPYDPFKDFAYVTQLTSGQFMLASHPSVPAKSIKQLIAIAKARPRQLTYASSGAGGINHLAGELLQSLTGIELVHVAYKGTGPAITALMGGHIDFMVASTTGLIAPVKAGKLRAIGVTGKRSLKQLPEVPTISEAGVPGYEVTGWYGMYAPANTPSEIIRRLHAETVRALNSEELREALEKTGNESVGSTPEEFLAFVRTEIAKWGKVVKAANISPE
jgi:tripartite-type tricarboxylate transporter receptor subunit TctC